MKKRELLERIEHLEYRIAALELGQLQTTVKPVPITCTCNQPWSTIGPPTPCPVHGVVVRPFWVTTTATPEIGYISLETN